MTSNSYAVVILRSITIFIAWLLVWQAGRIMEYTEHASVWFPAAGFTFACFLVAGYRALLPILTAAIVITIWNGHHYQLPLTLSEFVWGGFLFGLAHIFPYWAGASLIGNIARKPGTHTPQLIVAFLLVSCVSALLVTVLVILSLVYSGQMPAEDAADTVLPFWIGDMAGIVILTPLFTALLVRYYPDSLIDLKSFTNSQYGSLTTTIKKVALNLILIVVIMSMGYLTDSEYSVFAIFFLTVTHMWIACTESARANIISLVISSVFIVVMVHVLGLMEDVKVYQFALNVIAANALFGIAIPQLQADNRHLKRLVFIDKLTKAYTRDYMEQRAELEIAQSHESGSSLFLVLFDLDKFKRINDELGHMAGDEALKKVGQKTFSILRKTDIFARFGGDEFVLLLPALSIDKSTQLVDELREGIHTITVQGQPLSSSFGAAQLQPGDNLESLFNRADSALYESKKLGGNTITFR
ncbi:diguanylate cyclase [Aestuariibacter salexigens]|uniref:sensor domain-containing diguanylate cyclase n=1 Tax=Aestuariibacter salexigens TaxID=226010 RepID=UPI000415D85F|nr:diguanylate cyclase [Aestuariibacter salexigens]